MIAQKRGEHKEQALGLFYSYTAPLCFFRNLAYNIPQSRWEAKAKMKKGQTFIDYALLLSLVSTVASGALQLLGAVMADQLEILVETFESSRGAREPNPPIPPIIQTPTKPPIEPPIPIVTPIPINPPIKPPIKPPKPPEPPTPPELY